MVARRGRARTGISAERPADDLERLDFAAVVNANEICVVDSGRVVERGRHAELMAKGDAQHHIAKSQLPRDTA